jgi:hypothetical protein
MGNEMMTFPLESRIIFKINPPETKSSHREGKGEGV